METPVEPIISEPTPADKAALRSLRLSFLAYFVAGLTLWLANFFGAMACSIGLVLWGVAWVAAVLLAVVALRGAVFSDTPQLVRRRSLVSLVVTGVNVTLGIVFIVAVLQA